MPSHLSAQSSAHCRRGSFIPPESPFRTTRHTISHTGKALSEARKSPFRPADASFTVSSSMRPDAEEPVPHQPAMPEGQAGFLFHDFQLSKHFTTRTHIYALPRLSSTPLLTCLRPARKPRTPYRRPADAPTPQLFAATGRILKKND